MHDLPTKIGPPPAEIIVYINNRDTRFLRALFQTEKFSRHRPRVTEQLIRLRKIEVVDDVDQKERDVRFIRRAAVQIWISRRHDNETGRLLLPPHCSTPTLPLSASSSRRISCRPSS